MRNRTSCIDCGAPKSKDQVPPSPLWCGPCETARRARLNEQFAALAKSFGILVPAEAAVEGPSEEKSDV